MKRILGLIAAFIPIFFVCSSAQESASKEESVQKSATSVSPKLSVTRHTITMNGKPVTFTATAGYMRMEDESGKHKANIFFVSYEKEGENSSRRPITYAYNGGPGSSSVWLHLGALGPRRVMMSDEGDALRPPYRLKENEFSWLEFTDLVFIDPVTTGYSRPAQGEKKEQFHGVDEDARSVGEFIRLYTTRYKRWLSPKFLAGESYGTTRSAALSGYLQEQCGMNLNGILLISSILDFQTARFALGNDEPYALFLPTYTATAFYHKKLAPELQENLQKTLDEVRKFALNDYWLALAQGASLSASETERIATALARFTGLSKQFIRNHNLRVPIFRFTKELLRNEQRTVGRLDSRFKGIDSDAGGDSPDYDPSYDAVLLGTYTAALNDYMRSGLDYSNDLPYEILTGKVHPWNWGSAGSGYVNVGETLARSMTKNKHLKVFVANGYFDLATPFFATEYTFNHLGLEADIRKNITMSYYEAGHMMYIRKESLKQFTNDVREFYKKTLSEE